MRDRDPAAALIGPPAALAPMPEPPFGLAAADAAVEPARVYAAVDRGVAHGAPAHLQGEAPLYLLGGPLLLQELFPDQVEHMPVVEDGPSAARLPALVVAPLGGRGAVGPGARVTAQLAGDGRLVAPYGAGDLGDALPVPAHDHDVLALV